MPNSTPDNADDDFWRDGDYHLKSNVGRWDPVAKSWVQDDVSNFLYIITTRQKLRLAQVVARELHKFVEHTINAQFSTLSFADARSRLEVRVRK